MRFVNISNLTAATYETNPFPHTIIEEFLNPEVVQDVVTQVNQLRDENAQSIFINPTSPYEFNKFAFESNYGDYLKQLFIELNSVEFIQYLENLTGIRNIITNDITLRGAGVHRIKRGGYLQMHTDFNSYDKDGVRLDRRINLLIYLNPDWKEEYGGHLYLCDKEKRVRSKKILPILNRCVIFNTSNKSVHGHPEPLTTSANSIYRHSIAVYYYTKNENGELDFEGDPAHCTTWHSI
jgi:Rps23 Pro-64 3,4-dihydroxylase Tpa1-like proline 4-hydroxylase